MNGDTCAQFSSWRMQREDNRHNKGRTLKGPCASGSVHVFQVLPILLPRAYISQFWLAVNAPMGNIQRKDFNSLQDPVIGESVRAHRLISSVFYLIKAFSPRI